MRGGKAATSRGDEPLLGAHADGNGVSFTLFSAHAEAVELCLFDREEREEARIGLTRSGTLWRTRVDGLSPGQLYGYRVYGPYDPAAGHRFNPHKLLIDPYARRLSRRLRPDRTTLGYEPAGAGLDGSMDRQDSAAAVPKGVVVGEVSRPEHRRPCRPWGETVIYEAHVKGLTRLHPDLPEPQRGTYTGLGHPGVIAHLLRLGVTAIELLPIQSFSDDIFLQDRGLSNYWGYSPINYFAPEPRYGDEAGLATAIRTLHEAGIEVILDVVLNHTAEADHLGPTLSFRGVDNASYYKLRPDDLRRDFDCTGCGNTLNLAHPQVARLALDALRHWADAFGVDGFRFDLAPALARDPFAFSTDSPFLQELVRDPVLGRLKLIAEPWDTGEGGYRLGQFPPPFAEWNDRFRDTTRRFWRGDPGTIGRLAAGLAGSREIFEPSGRSHHASVNYVTAHDGFTLRDLVSYAERHNEANGEGNRDGHAHEFSDNHGHEGPDGDSTVESARARRVRNLLATIFLAQGVPMLAAGDELSRSQGGNNNPYCQDNATSWIDWSAARQDPALVAFVFLLSDIRRTCPALTSGAYLTGAAVGPDGLRDVHWLGPEGRDLSDQDWQEGDRRAFAMQVGNRDGDGPAILIVVNAGSDALPFGLPPRPAGLWLRALDTTLPDGRPEAEASGVETGGTFIVAPRSLHLFRRAG